MDDIKKLQAVRKLASELESRVEQKQAKTQQSTMQAVDLVVGAFKKFKEDVKSQMEIVRSIPPEKGDKGEQGATGPAGPAGRNGKDGKDGKDGQDGQDGISIVDARLDFDGHLVVVLSNGVEIDAGFIAPEKAAEIYTTLKQTIAAGTFTKVEIPTATTQSTLHENTTITGWIYSGNSFSISSQEGTPSGLFFSPDGLKMYVNGSAGDDVNEYTLSSAWNIATASYVTVFSTASQDSAPADLFFSPDGLTMFVIGDTNNTVYQYTLTTPWSVATASYASKSFSVATQETSPSGLWFNPDGTIMYVVGSANDTVYQYTLGTAWDVSTASYASISFSVATQEGTSSQVNLSSDGTKMWVLGSSGDDIWEYTLGTAWNVSTATPANNFYVGFQDTAPSGLFIDSSAANRVFMVGSTNDTVYKYNTEANSLEIDTEKLYVDGQLSVNGNLVAGSNAYVDGALTVQGAITSGGTSTLNAITVANNSTLVSATSSSSLNLSSGAVTSGNTKTVNIGTAGASGSTTTIAIGSAVSGATSTTTLNGLVINSISAAVSAAGSTQGTATALVSNINNVTVVAAAADGVRLPTAVAGMRILVRNSDSADTLKIYPATGGQINALGSNASYSLTAGSTIEMFASTTTQWFTF